MKKIFLVNPPPLTVLEPWFDAPKFVRTSIACLAGYLRENGKFEIRCLDGKFEQKSFRSVAEEVAAWKPDIIGLTAFTNEIKPCAYTAGLIKKIYPDAIIVIGGAHITAIPEQTMYEFPTFDVGVFGEGEETFLEFCNKSHQPEKWSEINGLVYKTPEGTIIKNQERARMFDQEALPMPAWDLLPHAEEYYIQTVRGCPFNCVFCLNHNGKVARKRGVVKVIEEMEWLINYGAKRISFGDELFSVDMHRTSELMDLMIEHKIGERVSWDIQTHVGYVNDDLFRKMKLANIEKCEMGVESGDEEMLKRMGKATTFAMIHKAFTTAHKHKIKTGSFLLFGQPFETHHSIWETIKIGIKINPTEPIFGTMVPYPGTEVANWAAKGEGGYKLVSTNWDEYRKQLNGSLEFTSISRTMLEWYQILGYTIVFLANFRFLDFLKFFWSYRTGAINLFKKALSGKKTTTELMNIPSDYNSVINSPGLISMEEMEKSRVYWKKVQADELKRTKQLKPNLLREQQPLKSELI